MANTQPLWIRKTTVILIKAVKQNFPRLVPTYLTALQCGRYTSVFNVNKEKASLHGNWATLRPLGVIALNATPESKH